MKIIAILIGALFVTPFALGGEKYQCTVIAGVVNNPGSSRLGDALKQDPSLSKAVFFVDRSTGRITGTALFDNALCEIKIVRNFRGVVDEFIVHSTTSKSDAHILRIHTYDGKTTFTYYVEFFGLFLSGECKKAA